MMEIAAVTADLDMVLGRKPEEFDSTVKKY